MEYWYQFIEIWTFVLMSIMIEFWYLIVSIDGFNYILINLHNANTEREQLTTIKNLNDLLKDLRIFMIKMWFLHEILTYRLAHGAGTYEKLIPLRFDTWFVLVSDWTFMNSLRIPKKDSGLGFKQRKPINY